MGRLIDADVLREEVYSWGMNDYEPSDFTDAIDDAPTVEAIPKDQYEQRLNADLKAILVELQTEIEELDFFEGEEPVNITQELMDEVKSWEHGVKDCKKVIQEKNRSIDCPLIEIKDLEIAKPFIINTLSMLRQDLLDHLAEEKSPYHISDVGIGLEIAINILNEYEERLKT